MIPEAAVEAAAKGLARIVFEQEQSDYVLAPEQLDFDDET